MDPRRPDSGFQAVGYTPWTLQGPLHHSSDLEIEPTYTPSSLTRTALFVSSHGQEHQSGTGFQQHGANSAGYTSNNINSQAVRSFIPSPQDFATQSQALPIPDEATTTNSNSDNVQPMGPPPNKRKPKAPTLRAKDWEPFKARITELYTSHSQPLEEVRETIRNEFGFEATCVLPNKLFRYDD